MIPGYTELLIIFAVILVIFGGKKIPELMGGFGKGIQNFKKGLKDPDPDGSKPKEQRLENKLNGNDDAKNELE